MTTASRSRAITVQEANPLVSMFSSVTGGVIQPQELTADYWVRNMVSPVLV